MSLLFAAICFIPCFAQKPVGKFMTDSIEIGKPINYVLSYHHLPAEEVFFPDTSYNFYPFELIKRTYLPTTTDQRGSLDSVVYQVAAFGIDQTQKLSLPVYILSQKDCTAVFSLPDTIFLKEMIKSKTTGIALKADINMLEIEQQIDYVRIIGYLVGLAILAGIIYGFFGKFIRKQYKLFRFERRHRDFVVHFKRLSRSSQKSENIGKALVLWKKQLEWIERKPYTSYTTKEIIDHLPNDRLEEALREIDSAIYGGNLSEQMPFAMNVLVEKAVELYKERRRELASALN